MSVWEAVKEGEVGRHKRWMLRLSTLGLAFSITLAVHATAQSRLQGAIELGVAYVILLVAFLVMAKRLLTAEDTYVDRDGKAFGMQLHRCQHCGIVLTDSNYLKHGMNCSLAPPEE
jgi:hypothetical protein